MEENSSFVGLYKPKPPLVKYDGIRKPSKITKENEVRFGLPDCWSITEFTFVNPTNSDCVHNIFQQNNIEDMPVVSVFSPIAFPRNFNTISSTGRSESITFSTVQDKVYLNVTNGFVNTIQVIHPITLVIETIIPIPFTIKEMAYSPVNNRIFGLSSSTDEYFVLDCATNIVTDIIGGVLGLRGEGITYNSIKNSFYVTDLNGNINEISSATKLLEFSVFIGGAPRRLTFVTSKNDVYINQIAGSTVLDWDCTTNTAVGVPIAVGMGSPISIKYCSVKDTVYVGSFAGIKEIDVVTNLLLATFIPVVALDLAYHTTGNVLYVSSLYTFSIVDCTTNTIIENFSTTYTGAGFMDTPQFVVDPINNRVFSSSDGQSTDGSRNYFVWETDDCFVLGSDNYNEWVRSTFNDPMLVRRIQYISQNAENFSQVLKKTKKDANGDEVSIPLIPDLSVCVNMYQGYIAQMEFEEGHLIFGKGGEFFKDFTVKPLSEIKMLIYYKQEDAGALLSHTASRETVFDLLDFPHNEPKSWCEAQLVAPQIPVMVSIVPFDFKMISPYKKPRITKIISRPNKEVEIKTEILVDSIIVPENSPIKFQEIEPKWRKNKRPQPKVDLYQSTVKSEVLVDEILVPENTAMQWAKPKFEPKKRLQPNVDLYESRVKSEILVDEILVPKNTDVQYVNPVRTRKNPVLERVNLQVCEIETEILVDDIIVYNPAPNVGRSQMPAKEVHIGNKYSDCAITVKSDKDADELIAKLQAAKKYVFSRPK